MTTPTSFTRGTLPKTLRDWRASGWEPKGTTPRDVWTPLEPFFLEQGLTLWKRGSSTILQFFMVPGKDFPRSPDGFVYSTPIGDAEPRPGFDVVVWFLLYIGFLDETCLRTESHPLSCSYN
jgi:hypothetical protein